ncbi:MAG: helix-turn-helix domain-containing protein [Pseudonocardiales bacterium]
MTESVNRPEPGEFSVDRKEMGKRLRSAREYVGLSQDDVAEYLDLSRPAVTNMEAGNRKVSADELARLARLYRRPYEYFIGGLWEGKPRAKTSPPLRCTGSHATSAIVTENRCCNSPSFSGQLDALPSLTRRGRRHEPQWRVAQRPAASGGRGNPPCRSLGGRTGRTGRRVSPHRGRPRVADVPTAGSALRILRSYRGCRRNRAPQRASTQPAAFHCRT